ncbi:cytochrome P450 [Mrakia frigida]|uniref:cytochrome P450 n=1 Tax=Mrakia frigida TaxID=29902 RepID=UPI003FCC1657
MSSILNPISAPLELTLVHYDPSDPISQLLAILTLSPMLVIPAYLAVFVFERQATVLSMLAGQLVNEVLSWLLKRYLKAERPYAHTGSGYASPSSHSQFFGYFFTFLFHHLICVQRPPARWSSAQRVTWRNKRIVVIIGVGMWSVAVAFSRWYLSYHTVDQIVLGWGLGYLFAMVSCLFTEVLPQRMPNSFLGRARRWVVDYVTAAFPSRQANSLLERQTIFLLHHQHRSHLFPFVPGTSMSDGLLLLFLLLLPIPFLLLRGLRQPRLFSDLPSIPSHPLVGHALQLAKHMREHETISDFFINSFAKPLGPISVFLQTSFHPALVLADRQLVELVLSGDKAWDRGDTLEGIFGGLAPLGMLALRTDATLRLHRRALAPTMSTSFLTFASTVFSSNMDNFLKLWSIKLKLARQTGQSAELFWNAEEDLHSLTTDAISQITFGESFQQLSAEIHEVEQELASQSSSSLSSSPSLSRSSTIDKKRFEGRHPVSTHMEVLFASLSAGLAPSLRHRIQRLRPSYQKAYWGFHSWLDGKIAASRLKIANGGEVGNIESVIDVILQKESTAGEGSVLPVADLRDELGTFMIAGEETSSTTMCWILKHLSENPGIQRRLHCELVKALPSPDERSPTYEEVSGKTTPYLEAFVHEILRVGQTVRATRRQAMKDTSLISPTTGDSIFVPKGTNAICILGYSCYTSSDDPRLGWKGSNVEAFRPERWLVENGAFDINAGPSIPFASGPRSCFGAKMALIRLPSSHSVPSSLFSSNDHSYVSITKTNSDEISIVIDTELEGDALRSLVGLKKLEGKKEEAEEGVELDGPWSCLKVEGPMVLTLTGIMAALTLPLRDAEVPIFAISTYDTDWLLVKRDLIDKAVAALTEDALLLLQPQYFQSMMVLDFTGYQALVEENIKVQVSNAARDPMVVQPVRIFGLVYDLETGVLKDLGITLRIWRSTRRTTTCRSTC